MGVAQLPLQPPVPLTANHLVTDFDCGVDSLNERLGKGTVQENAISEVADLPANSPYKGNALDLFLMGDLLAWLNLNE